MSYRSYKRLLVFFLALICGMIYILGIQNVTAISNTEFGDIEIAKPNSLLENGKQDVIATDSSLDDKQLMVIPCGEPIGIYVKSKGVMVISVGELKNVNGET
ncbi:MAG: hypothetical protein ACI4D8_08845, partial [Wujia sp.]